MSMIRNALHSGKTAGDLAKERNKLEVSRRIDQVPPAKKLDGKSYQSRSSKSLKTKTWPDVSKRLSKTIQIEKLLK